MIDCTLRSIFSRCIFGLLFIGLIATPSLAETTLLSNEPLIQAMFGISMLDGEETTLGDSDDEISTSMSTFPILSIMGQTPFITGTSLIGGFEGGGELSWLNDRSKIVSSNGVTVVHMKNKMLMGNILLGGFVSSNPEANIRFYAGAGTSLNWGRMEVDANYPENNDEIYVSESESSFGYGFYLRGGMEFMLADGGLVGLCAKLSTARIDYESSFSREDFNGFQIMMSYTAPVKKMMSPGF